MTTLHRFNRIVESHPKGTAAYSFGLAAFLVTVPTPLPAIVQGFAVALMVAVGVHSSLEVIEGGNCRPVFGSDVDHTRERSQTPTMR